MRMRNKIRKKKLECRGDENAYSISVLRLFFLDVSEDSEVFSKGSNATDEVLSLEAVGVGRLPGVREREGKRGEGYVQGNYFNISLGDTSGGDNFFDVSYLDRVSPADKEG